MPGHTLPDATILTEIKAQIDAASLSSWTVYRNFPGEDPSYDYIFMQGASDVLMSNKTSWGNNQVYHIHFWSKAPNPDRIATAESAVLAALTDGTFTVSGFNLAGSFMADGRIPPFYDPEAEAWHGVLPYRIITTGENRQ